MMAKDKTLSVRCDEATEQRFTQLAEQSGLPKAMLLPEMMTAYETQQLKNRIPGRADDIDAFLTGAKQLSNMYLASVDMALLAKASAKAEWQMEEEAYRKEKAILLQKQDELREKNEAMAKELQKLKEDNTRLIKENEMLKADAKAKTDTVAEIREIKEFVKKIHEAKEASSPATTAT